MALKDTSILSENRPLAFFLSVRILSGLAMQMLTVAVGWQIYTITGSPFYLGLVGLVQFIPMIMLTLVVGYAADHFNRKTIICVCLVLCSLGYLFLADGSLHNRTTKESLLIIVFFIGAFNAFQGPSITSVLPNIVSREVFPKAAALQASSFMLASILGPALGGLLYAAGAYIVYSVGAVFLLVAGVLVLFLPIAQDKTKREAANFKSVFAGISFIKSKPIILGAISLDLFAVLFGGATAMLPVYAAKILIIGPLGLGILRAAPAVGALIMSFYLARHPLEKNVGITMFICVMIFGLATIVFSLSKTFALSLAALAILGASDVVSMVVRSTIVQIETPDNLRGRVNSVNQMFIGTSNQLGEFESGVLASWLGVVPSVLLGGIGTIIVVLVWMKLFPSLVKVDKLTNLQE
jgi:MFS family permease